MIRVQITITKFYDNHQPGWVEAELTDTWNRKWIFREKTVSLSDNPYVLTENSSYPCPGELECILVGHYLDRKGRHVAVIRTAEECTDRTYLFEVDPTILFDPENEDFKIIPPDDIATVS